MDLCLKKVGKKCGRVTVDFQNDKPTFTTVFITWVDVIKGFFSVKEKNSEISCFKCLLWSSRSLGVGKPTSAFLLSKNVAYC